MKQTFKIVAVVFLMAAAFLFQSCVNTSEKIKEVSQSDEVLPLNIQKDIVYEYSDSSRIRLRIESPEVQDFSNEEEPYLLFPKGINVTFFDKLGKPESKLRANYAKRLSKKEIWEGRGDVQVENEQGNQLFTEQLFWNEKKQIIYTDVFVKIVKDDEVIMGTGMEADQNFESYTMGNISGEIRIDEQTEENDTSSTNR